GTFAMATEGNSVVSLAAGILREVGRDLVDGRGTRVVGFGRRWPARTDAGVLRLRALGGGLGALALRRRDGGLDLTLALRCEPARASHLGLRVGFRRERLFASHAPSNVTGRDTAGE